MNRDELRVELMSLLVSVKKDSKKKRLSKAINDLRLAESENNEPRVMELKMEIAELMKVE